MVDFNVYPAIDLHQGRVVRLVQGDLDRQTTYGSDPVAWARKWFSSGAGWLHLVNLDGAFEQAESDNLAALRAILEMRGDEFSSVKVQFGGGVRTLAMVDQVLNAGVDRVVLGTAAATDPALVDAALERFGADRFAAALDVLDNQVSIRGWVEQLPLSPVDLARRLAGQGVSTLIYTDISRDGTSRGTNLTAARDLASAAGVKVILSGGVASLADVSAAREAGLAGVIIGRALYEGAFALGQALKLEG
jgi:phosphoribosylformimino-5-aminoimidazole carboxamide ribotide isomerase